MQKCNNNNDNSTHTGKKLCLYVPCNNRGSSNTAPRLPTLPPSPNTAPISQYCLLIHSYTQSRANKLPIKRHEIFAFLPPLKTHTKTRMSDVRERELLGSLREQRLQRYRVVFVLSTRVHVCVCILRRTSALMNVNNNKLSPPFCSLSLFSLQIDYLHTVDYSIHMYANVD